MNDFLLAIDPGSKTVGWARFWNKTLIGCGVLRAETPMAMRVAFEADVVQHYTRTPHRIVVERPQVYVRERSEGDPNDLVLIALIGGMLAGAVQSPAGIDFVLPATWKGQVPKAIHHKRLWKRLALKEQVIVEAGALPKSLAHNCYDAVALGLWKEGRGR